MKTKKFWAWIAFFWFAIGAGIYFILSVGLLITVGVLFWQVFTTEGASLGISFYLFLIGISVSCCLWGLHYELAEAWIQYAREKESSEPWIELNPVDPPDFLKESIGIPEGKSPFLSYSYL